MNEEQRIQAFITAMKLLEAQLGVTVISSVNTRNFGGMLQIEPGPVQVSIIKGWQPPQPHEQS